MYKIALSILFMAVFSTSAFAQEETDDRKFGDDETSVKTYNIILDIGVTDPDSYRMMMKTLLNKGDMGASIVAGTDENGITDYSASFTIKDEEGNIIFDEFFTGAYPADRSDIIKVPLEGREPPFPREAYLKIMEEREAAAKAQ